MVGNPLSRKPARPAMVQESAISTEHQNAILETASVPERQSHKNSYKKTPALRPTTLRLLVPSDGKEVWKILDPGVHGPFGPSEETCDGKMLFQPVLPEPPSCALELRYSPGHRRRAEHHGRFTWAHAATGPPTERIVKYTSPGFESLRRLERLDISFAAAQTRLVELYQSDSSFRHHRDPSGRSYLQVMS